MDDGQVVPSDGETVKEEKEAGKDKVDVSNE